MVGVALRTDSSTATISTVSSPGLPSGVQSFQGWRFIRLSAYSVAASRSSGYFMDSAFIAAA